MDSSRNAWLQFKQHLRPGNVIMAAILVLVLPLSVYVARQTTQTQQHADSPPGAVLPTDEASPSMQKTLTPTPEKPTPTKNLDFLP